MDNAFDRYPSYTVLSYQGRRDVIEIRQMGPVFQMLDDPELMARINELVVQQ